MLGSKKVAHERGKTPEHLILTRGLVLGARPEEIGDQGKVGM
jgi:hypothetical protein